MYCYLLQFFPFFWLLYKVVGFIMMSCIQDIFVYVRACVFVLCSFLLRSLFFQSHFSTSVFFLLILGEFYFQKIEVK